MRKVILYIATSLDGYIADKQGNIDWLGGDDNNYQGDYGYSNFIDTIDTVIMGYHTYHQVTTQLSPDEWPYKGLKTYVFTHRKLSSNDEIIFTSESMELLIQKIRTQKGKSIWICGGANVINQLIKKDLIDEYHLSMMPIIFGEGIKLFDDNETMIKLKVVSTENQNGVLNTIYEKN